MKKILIGLLFAPLFFSCKKVLDTSPYDSITDASAFASLARNLLTLNGIYDAAQSAYYVNNTTDKRGYPFGAASIEQGDARGEDVVNVAAFFQVVYQATYNASAPNPVGLWKGLYILINGCNIGIEGFRKAGAEGVITSAEASQFEAECRFLRALSHHELLIHWARPFLDGNGNKIGIPYRENPINNSDAVAGIINSPRMRVDSVYAKILADLDYAEANLPNLNDANYRASKAAAIALKMRVKSHMGLWKSGTFMGSNVVGVIEEGAKLVPSTVTPATPANTKSPIGGWGLFANPDGPFVTNLNNVESIFSIKNDANDQPSSNGALAAIYGVAEGSGAIGRGLLTISPIIWNNPGWLCDDKRRTTLTIYGKNNALSYSYHSTKYRDYATTSDYAPIIRYAEVLLTLAEAEARNSAAVSSRAVDLLNLVRNRSLSNVAAQQYTVAGFASKNDLVKAILLERRIEFLAEGRRWSDISRLAVDPDFNTGGVPAKALNGTASTSATNPNPPYNCGGGYTPGQAAIPYSDFRFIWAIPQTERNANPIIEQNPGY